MNPIFPLFTIASIYTTPVQQIAPQVYYISNLSESDGAKCGEYISVTPEITQKIEYSVTPCVIPVTEVSDSEGD